MKLYIMHFYQAYLPFLFWGPKVHLSLLFSNTRRLRFYISITDQETLRYKTEGLKFDYR